MMTVHTKLDRAVLHWTVRDRKRVKVQSQTVRVEQEIAAEVRSGHEACLCH